MPVQKSNVIPQGQIKYILLWNKTTFRSLIHLELKLVYGIKRNEIVPFAATWMDLETVILSEVSQTQEEKYYMILLICGILKKGTNEDRKSVV